MSESANHDAPPPLAEAVGGALGIAESVLPSAAFVATYTATGQQTQPALIAAVTLGAFFAIARVVRGQPARFALAGLVGIAISAYVVSRTGRAEDFFLPGLLANAGYALASSRSPRTAGWSGARTRRACGSTAVRAGSGSACSRCGSQSSCRST